MMFEQETRATERVKRAAMFYAVVFFVTALQASVQPGDTGIELHFAEGLLTLAFAGMLLTGYFGHWLGYGLCFFVSVVWLINPITTVLSWLTLRDLIRIPWLKPSAA